MNRKDIVKDIRRIVIKVGSGVISRAPAGGLDPASIKAISKEIWLLNRRSIDVVLVSSGAVSAGMHDFSFSNIPDSIPYKQAAAAIGQCHLIGMYERHLKSYNIKPAQILLTHADLSNRKRYLNVKNTLTTLLSNRILPIVNENDTVSTEEIRFGDNDTLSAMVASLIEAKLLIILSDVDGLFTGDPSLSGRLSLITEVDRITPSIEKMARGSSSPTGIGGMETKLKAVKIASASGIFSFIINGKKVDGISRVMDGENIGTLFMPDKKRLKNKKHWIMYTLRPKGEISIDNGAINALTAQNKSLLPSGVSSIAGDFRMGDAVSCINQAGEEVARGLSNYDSKELLKIIGKKTSHIESILGHKKYYDEVIHKDNLVLV